MPFWTRRRSGLIAAADGEAIPVQKAFGVPAGAGPPQPIGDLSVARARLGNQIGGGVGGPVPPDIAAAMEAQGFDPSQSFSPGQPIQPWYGYSKEPRAWDLPTGWNIIARPRASISRASFDTLKALTSVGTPRLCIEHRIDALRSYEWRLVPAEGEEGNVDDAITAARALLRRPDGRNRFGAWLAMYLEDLFRYDAGALYKRRNRGGRVIGLEVVSGTTIAPLQDYYGRRPEAPAPAFVQYANGLPWDWLTDVDLVYAPFRPQSDSPYGVAPIEAVILQANSDLRLAQHLLSVYTDGSLPGGTAEAPPDLSTPEQIEDFQAAWDAWVEGDQTQKVKTRWVPSGTNLKTYRPESFDEPLALWFTRLVCAAYAVLPQSIGLTQDVNRATAEAQMDIGEQVGDLPLAQHVEDIICTYLQDDHGLPVRFEFDLGRDKEDRLDEAKAWQIGIELGAVGVDEFRDRYFGLPTDPERPVPRFLNSQRLGPIPLDSLFRVAGPVDSETQAPLEGEPLDTTPFKGIDGIMPVKLPGEANFHVAPIDPDDPEHPTNEVVVPGTDIVAPPGSTIKPDAFGGPAPVAKSRVRKDTNKGLIASGLVVRAADTGRILMLQRSMDDTDPAAGTWEFPGGHIEGDESAWDAAWREWQEETGCEVPEGAAVGSWVTGAYQGFVWEVPSETDLCINLVDGRVINPDDPDGDGIETCAWWDPSDAATNPALRPECRSNDWDLIATGSAVAKDMTGGVTASTGITGVNLHGSQEDPDEDEDTEENTEEVRKELRRWRDNARGRVKAGRAPRPFESGVLPAALTGDVWARLQSAADRSAVDAAFEPVMKAGRPKAEAHPGHAYDLAIAAHYAPDIARSIVAGASGLGAAAAAAHEASVEVGGDAELLAIVARAAVEAHVRLAPEDLLGVIRSLLGDAYLAGTHVGLTQTGVSTVTSVVGAAAVATDWGTWVPGHPAAADLAADGGFARMLESAQITLGGINDTTLDRLGGALADSLAAGDSVDTTAGALDDLLGDPDRAYLIAQTETARAMSEASLATYSDGGMRGKAWLAEAGSCVICAANEAAGVIGLGEDFPSGDAAPPAHPRCRCSVAPASLEGDSL